MTLIQRQDATVALLEPIHVKYLALGHGAGGAYAGQRARIKRLHIEQMCSAGYTQKEASESAAQCDDIARLNAEHSIFMADMGAEH